MRVQDASVTSEVKTDVLVIGAGPSGSMSSVILNKAGIDVLVLEKQKFPRFSIGESLLPQSMVFLKNAGLHEAVRAGGYQLKDGAAFSRGPELTLFEFKNKYSAGPGTTYQVKRADFDKRLADEAERQGVRIRYEQEVLSFKERDEDVLLTVKDNGGSRYRVRAGFVLDASGFGRVLPKLLKLEKPSRFPVRTSIFCHIRDGITDSRYDRNKILISIHPDVKDVWYWLIPFSDGTSSFGVVGEAEYLSRLEGDSRDKLLACQHAEPTLSRILNKAEIITDVREITGYSASVKNLFGKRYALLGNAGEFLDPVFSSGVTIAFKSAELACSILMRMHSGDAVDWQHDYVRPLMKGVDTFRAFVSAWYDGSLQDIIFYSNANEDIRRKVCSILAGYAWDESNPYNDRTEQRLRTLAEICRGW